MAMPAYGTPKAGDPPILVTMENHVSRLETIEGRLEGLANRLYDAGGSAGAAKLAEVRAGQPSLEELSRQIAQGITRCENLLEAIHNHL